MTQEDKELLLRDLCARLPYGVIVKNDKLGIEGRLLTVSDYQPACGYILTDIASGNQEYTLIEDVKLYLRPMSSMTEEERKELRKLCEEDLSEFAGFIKHGHGLFHDGLYMFDKCRQLDFCLSHHLDFRGLIPMGLALEAPEGMYNKEESEKVSDIPIPKTVDEAVKTLAKIVSEEDRDYLLENGAISMHDSMGRWIRNEWGLWTDSELKNELKKKGFEHPDDMSNYIIEEFIKYWNNKL